MKLHNLLLAILCATTSTPASAQWVHTTGPEGGAVGSLVMSGSTLLTGAYGGVYRSTDSAKTWTKSTAGLESLSVGSLVANETHVFAGTSRGVFMSSDAGGSWSSLNLPIPADFSTLALSGHYLFVGTWQSGLFRYMFDGTDWVAAGQYFAGDSPTSLTGVVNSHVFVRAGEENWRSTDNGETWQRSPSPFTISSLAGSGSRLYAGTYSSVLGSADSGWTWQLLAPLPGNGEGMPTCVALIGDVLYAGTEGISLARSSDGGASWTVVDQAPTNTAVNAMVGSGSHLYAATGGYYDRRRAGIYVSADSGKNWKAANRGLANATVGALASLGGVLYAGTGSWGAFRSSDSGTSWTPVDFGMDITHVGSFTGNDSTFYAAGDGNSVLYSDDAGWNWQMVDSGQFPSTGMARFSGLLLVHGSSLLAGRAIPDGVFLSTDRGRTWTSVLDNLGVNALGAQDSVVFAGGQLRTQGAPNGLFRSTDGGIHWQASDAGLEGYPVMAIAVHDGTLFAGMDVKGVYRSTNHGASWSPANTGLEDTRVNCFAESGRALFAGTIDKGVYVSTNKGEAWSPVNDGLTSSTYVWALAIHENSLYAGTGEGVWRRPLSEMVSTSVAGQGDGEMPRSFSLSQNYPNPFNPSTTIRYGLPHKTAVQLSVFNTLGQQVATLVEREMEAGYHDVQFDASHLASGVYLYRLEAGAVVQSRKMLLMK